MTTVVDAHAHVVVPGLGAEVTWRDGAQVVAYQGREIRAALREFVDLDRILEAQDAAGVDVVVLCAWVNLLGHEVGRQNEALAGMVGERVAALGTVDLERPELLVELMEDGRLRGVEIPAAPGGAYLGDARFRDFWAAAEQTGALVFVHPSTRGFVLPVMDELVVLKKRTPLPSLVMVLLEAVMFDWVFPSPAMFTAGPPLPVLSVNVLLSIRTLVRAPPALNWSV